jgi:hypothetical protein
VITNLEGFRHPHPTIRAFRKTQPEDLRSVQESQTTRKPVPFPTQTTGRSIFRLNEVLPPQLDLHLIFDNADLVRRHRRAGGPFAEHKPEGHIFERDSSLPLWHGWHAFRRGLATNLHTLGVDDKTVQAILRHSNIGITQNIYIKSVIESQVLAMDSLSEEFEICNDHATKQTRVIPVTALTLCFQKGYMEPRARVELATCRLRNEQFCCMLLVLRIRPSPPFAAFRPHAPT